jgi:hypothetical protein
LQLQDSCIHPQDGLLLGNGDFSVSVFHDGSRIGFRFGKSDVWDRRMEYASDPVPVDIEEFRYGLEVEHWRCGPYGGAVEALNGPSRDPQRMFEVCQGCSKSCNQSLYPCPKPVGELDLFLPPDLPGLKISSVLTIEEGLIRITCTDRAGCRIQVKARMHPDENILLIDWSIEQLDETSRPGGKAPIRMVLFRQADPPPEAFIAEYRRQYDCSPNFSYEIMDVCKPLDPPVVDWLDSEQPFVLQRFAPELTYPTGFECAIAGFGAFRQSQIAYRGSAEAAIRIEPIDCSHGWLAIGAATTCRDGGRARHELLRIQSLVRQDGFNHRFDSRVLEEQTAFWSASAVHLADPCFEALWYSTLHAQHCLYRTGKMAPGLYLPSTVPDYTFWHGDYHTNYNIQQPFWGMAAANHPELMKPYFELMIQWFLPLGRMIAQKYYHCRGAFIQLTSYPMVLADDPIGILPMGRMAYMTGWVVNQFWWYYRYTQDRDWLLNTGYPFMRECGLFYLDFLEKGEDGLYHAFPSNQGEDGLSGNPDEYRDCRQVMHHARYGLSVIAQAAEVLGTDPEILASLQDRLTHLAPPSGSEWPDLQGLKKVRFDLAPPEFGVVMDEYDGGNYRHTNDQGLLETTETKEFSQWYFGAIIGRVLLPRIRTGHQLMPPDDCPFDADLDINYFRSMLDTWRRPNGLYTGMSIARYGHCGVFTETLGAIAPLNEMLLQSWDGAIALFPRWPLNRSASFENFRAEGAFLVSAACSGGRVTACTIQSLTGGSCVMYADPKTTVLCDGQVIGTGTDAYGRMAFMTQAGCLYELIFAQNE